MRRLLASAALLASLNAPAAPASEESVEKLLAATKVEAMLDTLYASMEQVMRQGMKQTVQGMQASPEQQGVLMQCPSSSLPSCARK